MRQLLVSLLARKSEFPQKAMSALPPKADMCGANRHVCFGPERTFGLTAIRGSALEQFAKARWLASNDATEIRARAYGLSPFSHGPTPISRRRIPIGDAPTTNCRARLHISLKLNGYCSRLAER